MVAAAAIAGEVVDVRRWEARAVSASAIARVAGPAIVRARQRHRYRPHHARAVPEGRSRSRASKRTSSRTTAAKRRPRGATHPFDDPSRRQARMLIAGVNFGCGSSREHAPQALYRWGIRAVVAESFAEIFSGNSLMIGLPCVTVSPADLEALRAAAADACRGNRRGHRRATRGGRIDSGVRTISGRRPRRAALRRVGCHWPAARRTTATCKRTAERLPYIAGF